MKKYILYIFIIILLLSMDKSFSQIAATYERAEKLCLQAANKYDAIGCTESANYCRKMASWNHCMINALAGKSNSCGVELNRENVPYCQEAQMGNNGSNTGGNSSSKNSNPIKDIEYKQQMQQEFSNSVSAADNAYQAAIASGKKSSGAMFDATLAGSQYISDPKASLAYTGAGLGLSLISWISERKDAQRTEMLRREEEERLHRLEELKGIRESLKSSSTVFNFISSSTDYHYTNLKIEIKRGMVKSVSRKDLYDVTIEIHKVINKSDSIFIYESIKFKNLNTVTDSCVISKISIPLRYIQEVQLYNGDYTNAYDPKSSTNQIFRHKNLTNVEIKEAFTIVPMFNEGNQIGVIHSNLLDVNITTLGNYIKIQKKYSSSKPSNLNNFDFEGVRSISANSYLLVFDNIRSNEIKVQNFVDYLNFIKN